MGKTAPLVGSAPTFMFAPLLITSVPVVMFSEESRLVEILIPGNGNGEPHDSLIHCPFREFETHSLAWPLATPSMARFAEEPETVEEAVTVAVRAAL